jgi:hypothetical protein
MTPIRSALVVAQLQKIVAKPTARPSLRASSWNPLALGVCDQRSRERQQSVIGWRDLVEVAVGAHRAAAAQ